MTADAKTLEELTAHLVAAKAVETKAKEARIFLEKEVANLVKGKENSTKTVDAGSGFKVTVKRELGYKVDVEGLRNLDIKEDYLPLKATDPVPAGYDFDKKKYETLIEENPDLANVLAEHVVIKPKKISVTIKVS